MPQGESGQSHQLHVTAQPVLSAGMPAGVMDAARRACRGLEPPRGSPPSPPPRPPPAPTGRLYTGFTPQGRGRTPATGAPVSVLETSRPWGPPSPGVRHTAEGRRWKGGPSSERRRRRQSAQLTDAGPRLRPQPEDIPGRAEGERAGLGGGARTRSGSRICAETRGLAVSLRPHAKLRSTLRVPYLRGDGCGVETLTEALQNRFRQVLVELPDETLILQRAMV